MQPYLLALVPRQQSDADTYDLCYKAGSTHGSYGFAAVGDSLPAEYADWEEIKIDPPYPWRVYRRPEAP